MNATATLGSLPRGSALAGFLLLTTVGTTSASDQANQVLRSRMPGEIQKFTEQLLADSIAFETTGESLYHSGANKLEAKLKTSVKRRGNLYVLKAEKIGGGDYTFPYCIGINSKYAFELSKNKSGSAWLVSKVNDMAHDFDDTKFTPRFASGIRGTANGFVSELTMAEGASGPLQAEKLFDWPGFQLSSVSLDGPERNVLRAHFTYDAEGPGEGPEQRYRSDCVLEFDVGMHCLPTKFHQSYRAGSKTTTHDWRREWVKTGNDSYTVKAAIDTKTVSDSGPEFIIRIRTDMTVSTRPIPEGEFTLSAFGFAEPAGVEWRKHTPYYLWAVGVGVLGLASFVSLRVLAARRAASAR